MITAAASVRDLLLEAERFLGERDVPEAGVNAEFLMAAVLETGRGEVMLRGTQSLAEDQRRRFQSFLLERSRRIPLAYILGNQNFLGLELEVTSDVLVPRPETEQVVEAAVTLGRGLQRESGKGLRILDIGTGSGCIAIALASRLSDSFVVALDSSRKALAIAAKNAKRHGLEQRMRFVHADIFKPGPGVSASWADLVVSNAPYIPSARIAHLAPEVLQEPHLALDGGEDGLDVIRAIVADAPRVLRPGGWLVLEMDEGQGAKVRRLLERHGFSGIEIRRDFGGYERIALGRFAGK